MKVKNLYVGDIKKTQYIRTVNRLGEHYTVATRQIGQAIVYKKENAQEAKDVMSRKKYSIGLPFKKYNGEDYIVHLDHYPIYKILKSSGYNKQNITKRKLLKLLDSENPDLKKKVFTEKRR